MSIRYYRAPSMTWWWIKYVRWEENAKFLGEMQYFCKRMLVFCEWTKRFAVRKAIVLRENANVLWANAKFCGECSHFQRDFVFSSKSIVFPSETPGSSTKSLHLFSKGPHYICILSCIFSILRKQYCSLTKALTYFFLITFPSLKFLKQTQNLSGGCISFARECNSIEIIFPPISFYFPTPLPLKKRSKNV